MPLYSPCRLHASVLWSKHAQLCLVSSTLLANNRLHGMWTYSLPAGRLPLGHSSMRLGMRFALFSITQSSLLTLFKWPHWIFSARWLPEWMGCDSLAKCTLFFAMCSDTNHSLFSQGYRLLQQPQWRHVVWGHGGLLLFDCRQRFCNQPVPDRTHCWWTSERKSHPTAWVSKQYVQGCKNFNAISLSLSIVAIRFKQAHKMPPFTLPPTALSRLDEG